MHNDVFFSALTSSTNIKPARACPVVRILRDVRLSARLHGAAVLGLPGPRGA